MRDWLTDMAAFSALAIFLYGVAVLALAMDEPSHSAIVAATERN